MRASDIDSVLNVLKNSDVLPYIYDNEQMSTDRFNYHVLTLFTDPNVYILTPSKNSVFIFLKRNTVTYEVHVAILPEDRKSSRLLGVKAFQWMFENTRCKKIVASIPSFNRKCIVYAGSNGMIAEGVSRDSFLKDGVMYDLRYFGITEEEFYKEIE